jgi:hypothetical protein
VQHIDFLSIMLGFVIYVWFVYQAYPSSQMIADPKMAEDVRHRRIIFYVLLGFGVVMAFLVALVWAKQQGLF